MGYDLMDALKAGLAAADRKPKRPRQTKFSVGRRWRCTRTDGKRDPEFDFVIIGDPKYSFGKADYYKKNHRRCRLEVINHGTTARRHDDPDKCCDQCAHGLEQDYSLAHLKKFGVLVEE